LDAKASRDLLERRVARWVAERVVEQLEVVDVPKHPGVQTHAVGSAFRPRITRLAQIRPQ
jgi:hypothetical protein